MCVSPPKSFVIYKEQEGRKKGTERERKKRGKWRRRMLEERGDRVKGGGEKGGKRLA